MAEPLEAAQRRMPSSADVTVAVESIKFVRPDEAVVGFSLVRAPIPVEQVGGAVLVDGTWKVTRTTVTELLRLAGVACPTQPESRR